MEKYDMVKDIGSGTFGVSRLLRNKLTKELVAVKFLKRGPKIDHNVVREIMNHRILRHPNVIRFKQVFLTPTHLAISMEYGAGGTILERVQKAGRFTEDEARYFFQQLISGVNYCHSMEVSHRDLKLENTLLDGSPAPRLKICDFGFSTNSKARATVGTPAYMAPEVFSGKEYDGKLADVWSCGVVLYVLLVEAYPFENRQDQGNLENMIKRIVHIQYRIPDFIHLSQDCRHILSRIFVANPNRRITLGEIKSHPWFLKNLPRELTEPAQAIYYRREFDPPQNFEEIIKIIKEARVPPSVSFATDLDGKETDDSVDDDDDAKLGPDDLEEESDVDNYPADKVGRMDSEEDIAEARATKLVEESKTQVDDTLKLIFSGNQKYNIIGKQATKLDQGETGAKEEKLTQKFSSDTEKEDFMGTRATKLVHSKSAEDILNSVSSSNSQEMDILGERATKVVQSTASKRLATLTNLPSFIQKHDILGARATKQTISRTSGNWEL